MPRTPQLPAHLLHGPFGIADATAAGLTRHQLESQCWVRLFRQVWVHRDVELSDRQRFDAVRLALPPDAAATGRTAAWLFGAWSPRRGQPLPLDFGLPSSRKPAANSRRLVLDEGDVDVFHGVRVTTPERTCFGLMTRSSPNEAIVWADAFLFRGLVVPSGLQRYADERPYWPHVRKCRAAVARARVGAASPMETRLRLVIVDGGLPEPDWLNRRLYDAAGNFLGEPDMGYNPPDWGIEYDGEYHEAEEQRVADNRRENGLVVAGIPLLRYTKHDVYGDPARIVREVGAMLRRTA
ncbi:MAG: hypothetical protein ACT4QG_02790 [Sporichthyaceae bacterium]